MEVCVPAKDTLKKAEKLLQDGHKQLHTSSSFADLVLNPLVIFYRTVTSYSEYFILTANDKKTQLLL